MAEALPARIRACLTTLAAEVQAIAQRQRDATLAEHEAAVRAAVRSVLPALLTAVVETATVALDPGVATVRQRCPRCGGRARVDSWRPRQVRTVCGPITLRRPWSACRPCGQGFSPVDTTLALPPRARLSETLTAWLVRLGATTTFREAAALLADLTGLAVAADTIRAQREQGGTLLATAQGAAVAQVQASQEAAATVEPAPGTLLVEADGVMVRSQDGWHEVKVGLVGGVVDGEIVAPSSIAAREEAERFGPRLLAEAARRARWRWWPGRDHWAGATSRCGDRCIWSPLVRPGSGIGPMTTSASAPRSWTSPMPASISGRRRGPCMARRARRPPPGRTPACMNSLRMV